MIRAHLNLFFDVRSGTPVFKYAGVHSEDADNLTTDLSGRQCCITATFAEGETYGEAMEILLGYLKICPFYDKWIWEHLGALERP